MHKSTHFTGQPLYCQLLNLVNKEKIRETSRKGGFDRYIKKLDGYSHFVILLYGVLMRHDSLREIVIGMLSEAHKLQHLGIDYMVRRSTLSEANNRHSSDFFAQVYFSLYKQYKKVLPDSRDRSWEKVLHIMDSRLNGQKKGWNRYNHLILIHLYYLKYCDAKNARYAILFALSRMVLTIRNRVTYAKVAGISL